jgi:hypothetical protein
MKEGLRFMPQPAWYVGYSNAAAPSDGNILTSSVRYGFRGSKNMLQYMTKPYELPSKTRNEHTPQFLKADADFVDEYVPPVLMTTANTINNMEAPRLWPENAEYVTGYPKKKLPTIWRYKRETTVDLPERPASPPDLSHIFSRMTLERQALLEKTNEERQQLAHTTLATTLGSGGYHAKASRLSAVTAAEKLPHFQATWRETLERQGSASLRRTMKEDAAIVAGIAPERHYMPHHLLDPTDRIHYSGSTAVIVHSQSNDELAFRARMERVTERCTSPQFLQWSQIQATFDSMSRKLKRGQTMEQTIDKIAVVLLQVALHSGSETSIRRVDFVSHMSKLSLLGDDASAKTLSHLYSTFDPLHKNALRFVELLLRWKVLVSPELHLLEKWRLLWAWVMQYGADRSVIDRVMDVLTLCCGNNQDRDEVERLYHLEFKTRCLELAVLGKSTVDDLHDSVLNAHNPNHSNMNTSRPNTSSAGETQNLNGTGELGTKSSPLRRKTVRVIIPDDADGGGESPTTGGNTTRPLSGSNTNAAGSDVNQETGKEQTNANSNSSSAFHVAEHFLVNFHPPPPRSVQNQSSSSLRSGGHGRPLSSVSNSAGMKSLATYLPQTVAESGFMVTLRLCPQLLILLDRLLHDRLVQCYGKDERRVREEAERERELRNQAAEKQDFSWIINQSSANRPRPARAVLSLFEEDD